MNIVTLDHITKSYTGRLLFSDASFYLQEGEKVGIIGINGTGKSTLLRILGGLEEPDAGEVILAKNKTVQLLSQQPEFESGDTVLEAALRSHTKQSMQEQQALTAQAKTMLTELSVTAYDTPVAELSGGQRKRVALVNVLLHESDILLLDEPTNHLDAEMAQWLENFLKSYKGTLVMVTHDRYFLDSIANRIIEIDRGALYSYDTNYAGFLERKAQREEIDQAADRKRRSILRNELAWVMRGARARSTKQKARLERFEDLKVSKLKEETGAVEMSSVSTRMGKTTVELQNLSKAYGEHVLLRDFTYLFLRGDRVGFVGENGCGKTTLMKMIATAAGQLTGNAAVYPDSGSIEIGQTIKIGYYAQEISQEKEKGLAYMDPEKRVIDYVRDTAEFIKTKDGEVSAAKMCERFLFDAELQYSRIGKLSGGQKRRLNLLRVLMEAPNVLLLDEPTNDLDIRTLTILEDYLDSFDGIVAVVSHDRYFLDRTVRRIFAFEEAGKVTQYEGGYTDYQLRMKERKTEQGKMQRQRPEREEKENKGQEARQHRKKLSYKEQREYETIEDTITELEEEIAALEGEYAKAARDFVRLAELDRQLTEKRELLTEKMDRWMYLEELVAEIEQESKR